MTRSAQLRHRPHPSWRRERVAGWAWVALVVLTAACSPSGPAAPPAGQDADPGVLHVHRLAVDPTDPGPVFIATHTGLFLSDDGGPPRRVGDRYHDLMGFTITSEGRFLASGHPDLRSEDLLLDGAPALLGLAESTDRGGTWEPISLLGEADFHALEARHGMVYAADSTSGRLLVSSDGAQWATRSAPGLQVLAVSPTDPEVIVGGAGGSLQRSGDGGRTWQALASPPVTALAWDDDALYAALADGRVQASTDAGDTWEVRGDLQRPAEALLATDGVLLAAAMERGVQRSDDGARSWETAVSLR